MIRRLHVQNFKCLLDVAVDLGPLTVLIGPNDSGKTSVLEALQLVGQYAPTINGGVLGHPPPPPPPQNAIANLPPIESLLWRRDLQRRFQFDVDGSADGFDFAYHLELSAYWESDDRLSIGASQYTRDADRPSGSERNAIHAAMRTSAPYRFIPQFLRVGASPEPNPVLAEDGRNLAAVLDALLTGPDRETAFALEKTIRDLIPTIRGIALRTASPPPMASLSDMEKLQRIQYAMSLVSEQPSRMGAAPVRGPEKVLEFVLAGPERPGIVIPVGQVSDGALLVTAYLALAFSDTPGILLIEEPENGFHPSRMKMVVDLLRRMSTGEIGNRPRQIVMTTHSPILLNWLKPEEVRIVRRGDDGATRVTPFLEAPDVKPLLDEFAVGELWHLLGEEGLLKGQKP